MSWLSSNTIHIFVFAFLFADELCQISCFSLVNFPLNGGSTIRQSAAITTHHVRRQVRSRMCRASIMSVSTDPAPLADWEDWSERQIRAVTMLWISKFVIGLDLCPFAKDAMPGVRCTPAPTPHTCHISFPGEGLAVTGRMGQ